MSMINQKQVLSLQQKLSPQQIQMIKLLELPTMQLEQRIKQEIEENIVLEEDDHTPEDEQPQQISVEEYLREDETPSYKSRINNYSKDDKPRQAPLAGGRSLQEYLVEQLGYRNLSEQDMRLAVYLVGSIEEDGYLRRSLEAIADDIAFTQGVDVSVEHLERLLSIIHELEPTGVGARNLQECLLLQLDQENLNTRSRRLARKIVECYFDEFVKKHYEKTDGPASGFRGRIPRGDRRDYPPFAQTGQPLLRRRGRYDALRDAGFHPRLPRRAFRPDAQFG